jgi:hypothetical protein
MIHIVDLTNNYETTIYAEARKLLAAGADSADLIETWRNAKLSMSGIVGQCAKLTVSEDKHGKRAMRLVRWMPFPADRYRPETALNEKCYAG